MYGLPLCPSLVRRQRKVNPISLFWTLVLSFGIGNQGDLVSLRRSYENATGMTSATSSFYDRFTGSLVVFLQQACQLALHSIMETSRASMRETLSAFNDILITDATFCVCMICSKAHIPPVAPTTPKLRPNCIWFFCETKCGQHIQLASDRKHESKVLKIGD